MTVFMEMLNSGVLMRSLIALIIVVTLAIRLANDYTIPDWFLTIASMILGYYFGTDTPAQTGRVIAQRMNGGS